MFSKDVFGIVLRMLSGVDKKILLEAYGINTVYTTSDLRNAILSRCIGQAAVIKREVDEYTHICRDLTRAYDITWLDCDIPCRSECDCSLWYQLYSVTFDALSIEYCILHGKLQILQRLYEVCDHVKDTLEDSLHYAEMAMSEGNLEFTKWLLLVYEPGRNNNGDLGFAVHSGNIELIEYCAVNYKSYWEGCVTSAEYDAQYNHAILDIIHKYYY